MSDATIIKLDKVTRILEEEAVPVTLVEDIDVEIKRGEFVSVTGPSGSGKSSLMYLMGLLDRPTKGSVFIDGDETTGASKKALERIRLEKIGFIFQFHFLIEEFSAADNVMLPMRKLGKLSQKEMQDRAHDLLSEFGVEGHGHKKPAQLSGGERQRVALARALANDPLIILGDEPTGNLDTSNADRVFALFEKLVDQEDRTIVTITHDRELAKRADRQIEIVDGKQVSPPDRGD